MFSVNDINEMQKTIERKDKIIKVLKERVRQWVNEIIAELKAENDRLKTENKILLGQLVINDGEDVTVQISKSQFDKYNKFRTCLQEIKAIAEHEIKELTDSAINGGRYLEILDLITKAEGEDE